MALWGTGDVGATLLSFVWPWNVQPSPVRDDPRLAVLACAFRPCPFCLHRPAKRVTVQSLRFVGSTVMGPLGNSA